MLARCGYCCKQFSRKPSALKKYKHNYCSRKCANEGQKIFIDKESVERARKMKNTGRTHFKKGHLPWNKGLSPSEETKEKNRRSHIGIRHSQSEDAKQKISGKNTGHIVTKETRAKISKALKGKLLGRKHHNWRGGKSRAYKTGYYSVEYVNWRKEVFERDNYICQECGEKQNLNAHHIFSFSYFPSLRYERWNGDTLCVDCHRALHFGNIGDKNVSKIQ